MTWATPTLAALVAAISLGGCQNLHAGFSNEKMAERIQSHFQNQMPASEVESTLGKLGVSESFEPLGHNPFWSRAFHSISDPVIVAGDVTAFLYPKSERFTFIQLWPRQRFTEKLVFRMNGDDLLDDVVHIRSSNEGSPWYVIELFDSEDDS